MTDGLTFPRSNMPDAPFDDPSRGPVGSPDGGETLTFPSLSNEGLVQITLPLRNQGGMAKAETLLAKDFPYHVGEMTQRAFRAGPQEASATLSWYVGAAAGMDLLDNKTQEKFEKLSRQFAASKR